MFTLKPSDLKAIIPQVGGGFCEKFLRAFTGIPQFFHTLVSDMITEQAGLTDNMKTMICALGCVGGGGTDNPDNPSLSAPQGVNATDGTYSDKVLVTWDSVEAPEGAAAVTQYKVYRALSTVTNPTLSTLIATVAAPTLQYEDEDAVPGSVYRYWVKATNGTETSAYGGPDLGSADAPTVSLDPITDLRCTQGFDVGGTGPIALVWTPPAGATKYDIWRHTADDFSAATKIYDDVEPEPTIDNYTPSTSPYSCWDCDEEIVFYDFPPVETTKYWYWVVAAKDSPPAISEESNSAQGWVRTFYAPFTTENLTIGRGELLTEGVDFTGTNIRVVLFGGGGGGAGGSQVYGGGGGGGGGVVVEEFVISPGDTIEVAASPNDDDTGNAPAVTDGATGAEMTFKINGVTKLTAEAGGEGFFSASGSGFGGAAGSGSGDVAPTIYDGHAGKPGSGSRGGRTGYRFGNRRYPAAHFNGFNLGNWDGNGSLSVPGGGSCAAPGTEVLAVGGYGKCGYAVVAVGP